MYLSDLQTLAKNVEYKIDRLVTIQSQFLEETKKIRIAIESLINVDPYQKKEKKNGEQTTGV